jgi:aerobic-type carbon monoxide dehydrogenase small subunit (CoxS/CutS family)
MTYVLNVNGQRRSVVADPSTPLLSVLREGLKITGTKNGCGVGACGGCTVSVGGVATRACLLPVSTIGDRRIVTLADGLARCG